MLRAEGRIIQNPKKTFPKGHSKIYMQPQKIPPKQKKRDPRIEYYSKSKVKCQYKDEKLQWSPPKTKQK